MFSCCIKGIEAHVILFYQDIEDISCFCQTLKDSVPHGCAVVLMPLLPLHLITRINSPAPDFSPQGTAQYVTLSDDSFEDVSEHYFSSSKEMMKVSVNTFEKEQLHCTLLNDYHDHLEQRGANDLCTVSDFYYETITDICGPWGRLLKSICFSAVSGFLPNELPGSEALAMTSIYPGLLHLIDQSTPKLSRFEHTFLIGCVPCNLREKFTDDSTVSFFPSFSVSGAGKLSFLAKCSTLSSNSLLLFSLDVTSLFGKAEIYPDCCKFSCKNPIYQHSLDPSLSFEDVKTLVSLKVKEALDFLKLLKKCLPGQASIMLCPFAPQSYLAVEDPNKSFFSHNLLHKDSIDLVQGSAETWSDLYLAVAAELSNCSVSLDAGLETIMKSFVKASSPSVNAVTDLSLYNDNKVGRGQWCDGVAAFISRVQSLKMPGEKHCVNAVRFLALCTYSKFLKNFAICWVDKILFDKCLLL